MNGTIKRITAFVVTLVLSLSLAASAALAAYATIPYGEQSNAVRKMQSKLKAKGYYKGMVDGKFGPGTKAAVIKFQKALGITADGKPGNKTLTALYEGRSAINGTYNTERKQLTNPTNPRSLYYGCTGSRVRTLQRALKKAGVYKGSIDGVYGDLTYDAVVKYQRQKGLHADGIAGVKTQASLKKNTGMQVYGGMVLAVGSKGEEVNTVRNYLTGLGYNVGNGSDYDTGLEAAVKRWQTATGQKVTGTISERTYNDIVTQ